VGKSGGARKAGAAGIPLHLLVENQINPFQAFEPGYQLMQYIYKVF
jgi:hypothetical protein